MHVFLIQLNVIHLVIRLVHLAIDLFCCLFVRNAGKCRYLLGQHLAFEPLAK